MLCYWLHRGGLFLDQGPYCAAVIPRLNIPCVPRLTKDLRGVGAAVEEDTRSARTAVVYCVVVDPYVIAPFRGDDAWVTPTKEKKITN